MAVNQNQRTLLLRAGALGPVDLNFTSGKYFLQGGAGPVTTSRASIGTNLLPTSPNGSTYATFGNNIARITPGLGDLIEETRTNYLLNSTAPATQTTGSLGTGTYTLWVNGSGSATMALGTGVGCGIGSATQGSPISFTISVAGTCAVTVAGSLNEFQLEKDPGSVSLGTSFIPTGASPVTRQADVTYVSLPPWTSWGLAATATPSAPMSYQNNQFIAEISDGTDSNRLGFYRSNSTELPNVFDIAGGSAQFAAAIGGAAGWAPNVSGNISLFVRSGLQRGAYNGVLDTNSYSSSTLPTGLSKLYIGSDIGTSGFCNCYEARIIASPQSLLPY
jgi:hypothetical protein